MTVSTPHILFELDHPIARLTFNRPEARNAMTWAMYESLVEACDAVDADAAVRVLILRGAGGRAFVAGTDIAQFQAFHSAEDGIAYETRLDAVLDRLERVTKVTIAEVQGVAAGGGCAIALTCDLCISTPDSTFGIPIARTLGNCLSAATCARLVDLVGPARARDLLFTGRLLDAKEAASLGLVNRLAEPDAIRPIVEEVARTIAANAPLTIQASKEMIRRIQVRRRLPPEEGHDLIAMCYTSTDFKEGIEAFLGRRRPEWRGK